MGYTSTFFGQIRIDPPLNAAETTYLECFAATRRMRMKDGRGPYFVLPPGAADHRENNVQPITQPGTWCQWVPVDDGAALAWDGGEKFYGAEPWMRYLIEHFLRPEARASQAPAPPPPAVRRTGLGRLLSLVRREPAPPAPTGTDRDPQFAEFTFNHQCNGTILVSGEEYPDLWRLDVQANVVTSRHYLLSGNLPEAWEEEGRTDWHEVIFALESDPQEAMEKLESFLDALPEDQDRLGLRPFLRDLAAVLPPSEQEPLTLLLDRRGM